MAIALLKDRLVFLRKRLKLTQKEFAEKLGVSQSYISEVENGQTQPGISLLVSLNLYFNVSVDWLITGQGRIFTKSATTFLGTNGRLFFAASSKNNKIDKETAGLIEIIVEMLDGMPIEDLRDIQKHIEKEKRIKELENEVKELKDKSKCG